jgi:hypothetical protein
MSELPKTLPADFEGFDKPSLPKTLPADFQGFDRPARMTAPELEQRYTDWPLRRIYGLDQPQEAPIAPVAAHEPTTLEDLAASLPKILPADFTKFDEKPVAAPPVSKPQGVPSFAYAKYGMGKPYVTGEDLQREMNKPLVPIGTLVREQINKIPDDPQRWALNTVLDLGQLSADTIEGLSTPENVAILTALYLTPEVGIAKWVHKLVAAGFSADMAKASADKLVSGFNKAKRGEYRAAGQDFASGVVDASFSVAAGLGVRGRTPGLGRAKEMPAEQPVEQPIEVPVQPPGTPPPRAPQPTALSPVGEPPAPVLERRAPGRPNLEEMPTPELQTLVTALTDRLKMRLPSGLSPRERGILEAGRRILDQRGEAVKGAVPKPPVPPVRVEEVGRPFVPPQRPPKRLLHPLKFPRSRSCPLFPRSSPEGQSTSGLA